MASSTTGARKRMEGIVSGGSDEQHYHAVPDSGDRLRPWVLRASLSAHGGNHAGRDGRTPTDDPRLLASQRSARDQQVSPGNNKKQTPRAGEARGCHPARWRVGGKQINLDPLAGEVRFFGLLDGAKQRIGRWETLIGPKRTQIVFGGSL